MSVLQGMTVRALTRGADEAVSAAAVTGIPDKRLGLRRLFEPADAA